MTAIERGAPVCDAAACSYSIEAGNGAAAAGPAFIANSRDAERLVRSRLCANL